MCIINLGRSLNCFSVGYLGCSNVCIYLKFSFIRSTIILGLPFLDYCLADSVSDVTLNDGSSLANLCKASPFFPGLLFWALQFRLQDQKLVALNNWIVLTHKVWPVIVYFNPANATMSQYWHFNICHLHALTTFFQFFPLCQL